jgi:membrane protease YdiL (CAAX protease family)
MAFRRSGVRIPSGPPIAAIIFASVWFVAAASLAVRGRLDELVLAGFTAVVVLIGIVLTLVVTRPATPEPRRVDARTAWQAAVLVAVVLFSCVRFGPPALTQVTGWGYLPGWTYPVVVFLLPVVVVVALGARAADIGLHRGHRPFAAAAVWVALRGLMLAPAIVAGKGLLIAGMLVLHLVGVAFPEELLFRGLLQSRLSLLLGSAWAVVVTALLFGLWHLGVNATAYGGDLATAAARSMVVQGMLGLGYGVALARTRSLVAPSLAHAAFNAN